MKFNFRGYAELLHINARKEGPDEDKVLAADVKMRATGTSAILDFFMPELAGAVFTNIGAVRNEMLGPLTFTHELEHYRLEIFGDQVSGCRVKKFSLEPKDTNQIALTFQVSFQPSGDEVARLAEYLQDEIEIRLEPEDGELDLVDAMGAVKALDRKLRADGIAATVEHQGEVMGTLGAGR